MARAELRIYDRDGTTLRDTIAGLNLAASHGKGVDSSDLSFSGKVVETAIGNDPGLFDDALAKVFLDSGEGMVAWGTPYVLAPGGGTVIGPAEQAAHEFNPVGKGALVLTNEMLVLHYGGQVHRRGPRDIVFGWQHPAYSGAGFYAVDAVARTSLTSNDAKYDQPAGWNFPDAKWIYDDNPAAGGLTMFRSPTFVVPIQAKYYVIATADEEYKVSLYGPGYGGVIIEESAQEDGFEKKRIWGEVLQPGTYRLSAEMTTVNSEGGDGWDAFSCGVGVMYRPATLTQVMVSDASWRCLRQTKSAARPGMTVGQIVRIILAENQTWGVDSASLLVPSFTDTLDSAGVAWPTNVERSWPVGTTLAQVIADFSDLVDFEVDSSFALHAYLQRGSSKTSIALTAGAEPSTAAMNVQELTYQSEPITATRAVVLSNDRFTEVIDATAEVSTNSRGAYLESSQTVASAEATRLGTRFIDENKTVRTVYTAKVIPVDGNIPGRDYSWGDTITGLSRTKAAVTGRVLRVSLEQGDNPPMLFTIEYQEV